MRVIIEAGVFCQDKVAERHDELLALFMDAVKGRHTIEIEPFGIAEYKRWLEGEGARTRELCKLVLKNSLKLRARRPRAHKLRIADIAAPLWADLRLPLSEALRFLRRPLRLLVENALNERKFLRVITRLAVEFDLEKLIKDGVIEIETNGGVDTNRGWLEEYGHVQEDARRMWVMCDSDAKQAWLDASGNRIPERLGSTAVKLEEVCKKHKIPLHILRRRAIDNYVPLELLAAWSYLRQNKRQERHRAFASLTDEQRYHYNMKDGFLQDEKDREYAKRVGCLYHGLKPGVRRELESGFNSGKFAVTDLFDETKMHDDMATFRVLESWLRKDKQEEEARRIAEAIQELL